jgi:hypothetical protein
METARKSLFAINETRKISSSKRSQKAVGILLCLSGILGITFPSFVQKASASKACNAEQITINSGGGAESPSRAWGHTHRTGNHYVKYISRSSAGNIWYWYADNNGGIDGDTADTYYGSILCGGSSIPALVK